MRAVNVRHVLTALLAISAPFPALGPRVEAGPFRESAAQQTIAVMIADQSLYLCPLCGEQFLSAYRRLAARLGPDAVWVVVPSDGTEAAPSSGAGEAAARRIRLYLRSRGCPAPVLLDRSGYFHSKEGKPGIPGFVLDSLSELAENLAGALPSPREGKK